MIIFRVFFSFIFNGLYQRFIFSSTIKLKLREIPISNKRVLINVNNLKTHNRIRRGLGYLPQNDYLRKQFIKKTGKGPDLVAGNAYAAGQVLFAAIEKAGKLDRKAIRDAVRATDMMTVFGPIIFVNWGKMKNQNKAATYVVQWIDGKLELVWPTDHATKRFRYPVDWMKAWGYW